MQHIASSEALLRSDCPSRIVKANFVCIITNTNVAVFQSSSISSTTNKPLCPVSYSFNLKYNFKFLAAIWQCMKW